MSLLPPIARRASNARRLPVRWSGAFAAAIVAMVSVALVAGDAGATTDARAQRSQVRAEQAKVAAQVDAMQGTQAQVLAALSALEQNVSGQQAVLANARQQAADAQAEAAEADRQAEATTRELDALREQVARYAKQAYVSPPTEDLMRRFEASSAQEDATRQALLAMQTRSDADAIDQLRATKGRLEEQRNRAEQARAAAEQHIADATAALAELDTARSQQQAFAAQVRARLDDRLADAAYLSRLDASFGAQIAAEEAALARAVAPIPVTPVTTPPSGGSSGGTTTTTPPAVVAHPPLTTVGGITVAASIAGDLRSMLDAAAASGFRLGGYGYRDINVQIQLRRQNCGTSNYAIWEMPADSCSPPTARPGLSWHEQGLAVDFTSGGSFINTRSNPAFVWMAANAARFGFTNLPSEPWHWSHPA